VQAAHPDKRIEIWFQDEARFGQQGTIARVWAKRGSRPRAVKQTRYDWVYVLAAACPQTGRTAGLISPHLNTEVVNVFFEQMAAEIDDDVHVVLIWDQAGFHTSAQLRPPDNITLISLPPYSPELNPMENLWHYLRSHHWSNRAYADYNALRAAVCDSWQTVCLDSQTIKTVCHASYLPDKI
jgi:transposase